jgi:hypothetical protein
VKPNLRDILFGFRTRRNIEAATIAAKADPVFNEEGTTLLKRPRRRVIGITEQRLRDRNQGSWMMSAKAWKKFMLGFPASMKKTGS